MGSESAKELLTLLQKYVDQGKFPWAVMQVSGFEDSPVSFFKRAHSVLLGNGDNDYSILILPSELKLRAFIVLGPKDGFS